MGHGGWGVGGKGLAGGLGEGGTRIEPGRGVFRHGDGWATYVVDGGRAHLRRLQLGRRNNAAVEVLGGLRKGERVVLYPTDNVSDGVRAEAL